MLKGRRMLFTDEKDINIDNITRVVFKAFNEHAANSREEQYLFEYESGAQPIDEREKPIRPEINIKVKENDASMITDFKLGYEFGNPIIYIQKSRSYKKGEGDIDDVGISLLNMMMAEQSKSTKDVELARNFKICALGYRMVLPNNDESELAPFKIMTPNPLTTFVIYSNDVYREPKVGVTFTRLEDGTVVFGAYTRTHYYTFQSNVFTDYGVNVIESVNMIGEIPIIEYVNNFDRTGCFEKVISIMDAKNITDSDRVNDIAQHVQSLLWMHDCEIDEEQKESLDDGIIMTQSTGTGKEAKIAYLSQTLNQSETQTLVNYFNQQIMEICGVPMRSENGGGSTGSAVSLSSGWQMAETNARTSESIFEQSERRFLKAVLNIIKTAENMPPELTALKLTDIETKFSRNKTYDLISKANALATLSNIGVDGLRAFETVGLFTDPQQAWNDSKDMYEAIQKGKANSGKDTKKLQADASDQPQKVPNTEL